MMGTSIIENGQYKINSKKESYTEANRLQNYQLYSRRILMDLIKERKKYKKEVKKLLEKKYFYLIFGIIFIISRIKATTIIR